MKDRFVIREMKPEHCEGKAYVHYRSWQETYRGIMDDQILDGQSLEEFRKKANSYPDTTLVLLDQEKGGQVVGFACYLAQARNIVSIPDASELCSLFLLDGYKGLGLGRRLMETALARLPQPTVVLFVLEGNQRAIGFYEHMGFRFTGHRQTVQTGNGAFTDLEMVLERENQ